MTEKEKAPEKEEQPQATETVAADELAALREKAEKLALIEADYARLQELAQKEHQTVSAFLTGLQAQKRDRRREELMQSCSDEKLVDHVLALEAEQSAAPEGLDELKGEFPEMDELQKVPAEVLRAAEAHGSKLLDEYLRYLRRQSRERAAAEQNRRAAKEASIGSQKHFTEFDPVNAEFLRGLWAR